MQRLKHTVVRTIPPCLAALMTFTLMTAQTVVEQGQPEPPPEQEKREEVTHLKSPMILRIPLKAALTEKWGRWVTLKDMAGNYCDDVEVTSLSIRMKSWPGADAEVSIRVSTYTLPGVDRLARLTFELISGEEVILEIDPLVIDAEEDSRRKASGFTMAQEQKLRERSDTLQLRVVVSVSENG